MNRTDSRFVSRSQTADKRFEDATGSKITQPYRYAESHKDTKDNLPVAETVNDKPY
jgi:hypothetical protein